MNQFSQISLMLKQCQRKVQQLRIHELHKLGFLDLRPSFLEILAYLDEHDGSSIKAIGEHCQLKKQTMTSHLNELLARGYIRKNPGKNDKRQFEIYLTEYGKRFQVALKQVDERFGNLVEHITGAVEMERLVLSFEVLQKSLSTVVKDHLAQGQSLQS